MKHLSLTILALIIGACSASSPEELEAELVGNDRDDHGCIASAGYQWSIVKEDCIRLWEEGVELIHQGSGDPNFSAFVVKADEKVELFLPEREGSVLLERVEQSDGYYIWQNEAEDLVLDAYNSVLMLTDSGGFVLYAQEGNEAIYDDIPVHSSDEWGAEPVEANGVVSSVEDGPYPMFTLHITLDDEAGATPFSLNAEGSDLGGVTPDSLEGQRVSFVYFAPERWDLMAILPMESEEEMDVAPGEGWRIVSGRLQGAADISQGDLPDIVTISMITGEHIDFEYFIDPELMALNESDVTAWLAPQQSREIQSLRVQP